MSSLRRRYFLLDEPCPASQIPLMMCRVVKDMKLPLFMYAPVDPLTRAGKPTKPERPHNPRDIIPEILPEPSLTTNRKDFLSTIKDKSLKASVSKLFGLDGGLNNEQKVNLETKEVRRYTIKNPGEYFNVLMGDELYQRDVRALLKETSFGKAYLVVGFLTTINAQWSQESSHKSSLGTTAPLPITEIAWAPPIPGLDVDPTLTVNARTTQKSNRSHESTGEEIFAVAYAPVKTMKLDFHKEKKVIIGPSKTADVNRLAFSPSLARLVDDDDEGPRKPKEADNEGADIQLSENGGNLADSLADEAFDF